MFSSSFVSSAVSGEETAIDRVERALVERAGGALGAGLGDAADDLRASSSSSSRSGRVDALGREREVEVRRRPRARRRRGGGAPPPASFRGTWSTPARRGGPCRSRSAISRHRSEDDREVGLAVGRERRRQRDQDGVRWRRLRRSPSLPRALRPRRAAQLLRRDVLDVALAPVERRDHAPASTSTRTTLTPASAKTWASGTPT